MVKTYLSVLVQSIGPYGYSADVEGLQSFSRQLAGLQQTHSRGHELADSTKKAWRTLIQRTFEIDVTEGTQLTLMEAQSFSIQLSVKLQVRNLLYHDVHMRQHAIRLYVLS